MKEGRVIPKKMITSTSDKIKVMNAFDKGITCEWCLIDDLLDGSSKWSDLESEFNPLWDWDHYVYRIRVDYPNIYVNTTDEGLCTVHYTEFEAQEEFNYSNKEFREIAVQYSRVK